MNTSPEVVAAAMMDLGDIVRPDLTVVDMIRPMEGFGPHSGTPVEFGSVVAGQDMVAIDATACRMAALSLDKVEYFDAEQIEIRGSRIEDVQRPLYLPCLEGFDASPEYNFHIEKACRTCQGLLSFTMSKLKASGKQGKFIVLPRCHHHPSSDFEAVGRVFESPRARFVVAWRSTTARAPVGSEAAAAVNSRTRCAPVACGGHVYGVL